MSNSPDRFHHVRMTQSSIKSSNINLQLMEFKAHNQAVSEYKLDMMNHLLSLEPQTQPNLSLIQQQPEISLRMRPLLLDFLMDVINKLNLSKSTFPLTVNLIDRYCSIRIVKKQHYQLLGLTCLWISCKDLDSKFKIPSLNDLCKMCCNCYDKKLFLEMENHVLKSLGWMIGGPTFDSFIDFYINLSHTSFLAGLKNNNKICNDLKILSIYICELIQFYPNIYFNYNSSQIALTSFITSLYILEISTFNSSQFSSSLYQVLQQEILTTSSFNSCFQLLIKVLKCPPPSLKLKYFNDDGKYIYLMKQLITFTNKNLNNDAVNNLGAPSSNATTRGNMHGATTASSSSSSIDVHAASIAKNYSASGAGMGVMVGKGGASTPKFYPTTPTSNNISPLSSTATNGPNAESHKTTITTKADVPKNLNNLAIHELNTYCTTSNQVSARSNNLPSPKLSPAETSTASSRKTYFQGEHPVPSTTSSAVSTSNSAASGDNVDRPAFYSRKRSHQDLDIANPQPALTEVKRTKSLSTRSIFYIS